MALSESLDTSTLNNLFEDDWHNLYKPMNCCDTHNNSALLDELIDRQNIIEEKIDALDAVSDAEKLLAIKRDIVDLSTLVHSSDPKKLEEIKNSVADISTKLAELDVDAVLQVKDTVSDISTRLDKTDSSVVALDASVKVMAGDLAKVKKDQEDVESFLSSIFQWENQEGTILN